MAWDKPWREEDDALMQRIFAAVKNPVCAECGAKANVWCFLCDGPMCERCHTHLLGDQDEE